jgi:hypothetical protein
VQIIHLWYFHQYRGWPWPEDFAARLRGRYYAAVISDESIFEGEPSLKALLEANYTAAEVLAPEEAPRTLSGLVVRPQIIYRPRPPE